MHAESTAGVDHLNTSCRHCGAPLVRVVTSYRHNLTGDVCSVGWTADHSPFALPCGAPCTHDQHPRYCLTDLGLDALRRAEAEAWLFGLRGGSAPSAPAAFGAAA